MKKLDPLAAERAARCAYKLVLEARDILKAAGARRAVDRLRLACTSAQGAVRAAEGRASRFRRANPGWDKPPETPEARHQALACPSCGEPPGGTVEMIPGTAKFVVADDGLSFEFEGETDPFWDGIESQVDPTTGTILLACSSCGEEYPSPHWFKEGS